ncbi:dihydrofolate reductase family protein [Nocardia sp. CS682]|uniref:dihydrofolate reductase family protein n=1 Tax=Nocardia sp. CS682 TaxID=1047172 RepID=UPI001F0D68FB|nr:dihydrofolate reductase family protein [Nocardia sp. CS682]
MGGGVLTAALQAGLVDEVVLHQIPILLGNGRPFFQSLPEHVRLRLIEAIPAPASPTCTTRSSDDPPSRSAPHPRRRPQRPPGHPAP